MVKYKDFFDKLSQFDLGNEDLSRFNYIVIKKLQDAMEKFLEKNRDI